MIGPTTIRRLITQAVLYPTPASGYSQTPADLFAGMSVSGTDMIIPIAALADHGLTATLAAESTGDARMLAYCFTARIEEWYADLTSTVKPTALLAVAKSSIPTAGDYATKEKTEITVTAYRERPDGVVATEAS